MASCKRRILQWNVFEDGLTDAPGSVGFSSDFDEKLNALLTALSDDGSDSSFHGFERTRDYSQVPAVVPISSSEMFLGFVDVLYNGFYHALGGQARFGSAAPGQSPELGNTLRSLFLKTDLRDRTKPPSASNPWTLTDFEQELEKTLGALPPDSEERNKFRDELITLRGEIFDPARGALVWERSTVEKIWKRETCAYTKLSGNLGPFMKPCTDTSSALSEALGRYIRVIRSSDSDSELAFKNHLSSLVEVLVDNDGQAVRMQTPTFQSSMWNLLNGLCKHSLNNAKAKDAIATFAGTAPGSVPATSEDRVALIFPSLLQQVQLWFEKASLQNRSRLIHKHIDEHLPSVVTMVEYNGPWRRMPIPTSKPYVIVSGMGEASILYDNDEYERLHDLEHVSIPDKVRSEKERGVGDDGAQPKSSCVVLLRGRTDSSLILVVAAHLESAPPSDTPKVLRRQRELKAALSELSQLAKAFAAAGRSVTILMGGDFNALREEFVYGTGDAFWAAPGVVAVKPPLKKTAKPLPQPEPPFASLAADGTLRLLVDGVNGGQLREVSRAASGDDGEILCTRAGKSMVIDFIFAGTVGAQTISTEPRRMVSPGDAAQFADAAYGIHRAVLKYGSDHLPVACDFTIG